MVDKHTGWYKLQRSLLDSKFWQMEEPFGKRDAYIDLLLLANYEEKPFYPKHSNQVITVHVGQLVTSYDSLALRWKWSKKRVANFLNQLEKGNMISRKIFSFGTVITLLQYSFDGGKGNRNDTGNDTDIDTRNDTRNDTRKGARLKKDKNSLKEYKESKEPKKRAQRGLNPWEGDPE